MSAPTIELAKELITQLELHTEYDFERRVAPYLKRPDVVGGKWIVIASGDSQARRGRKVDLSTLTIDIAYQEALPDKTTANPNPLENLTWFDATMAKVESLKNLFRPGGELHEHVFATGDAIFQSMENAPLYRPDLHVDYQIFTSVVRLEFLAEIPATEPD